MSRRGIYSFSEILSVYEKEKARHRNEREKLYTIPETKGMGK